MLTIVYSHSRRIVTVSFLTYVSREQVYMDYLHRIEAVGILSEVYTEDNDFDSLLA
jgi:hypothetical protein